MTATAMRFAGRWRCLFHTFSPCILTLRRTTLASIDQELKETNIGNFYKSQLRTEYELLKKDIWQLSIESANIIDHKEVADRPERSAIRLGYTLLLAGHSPNFLVSRSNYWADRLSAFSFNNPPGDHHAVTLTSEPFFSLPAWKTIHQERVFVCYFTATSARKIRGGLDFQAGRRCI